LITLYTVLEETNDMKNVEKMVWCWSWWLLGSTVKWI